MGYTRRTNRSVATIQLEGGDAAEHTRVVMIRRIRNETSYADGMDALLLAYGLKS